MKKMRHRITALFLVAVMAFTSLWLVEGHEMDNATTETESTYEGEGYEYKGYEDEDYPEYPECGDYPEYPEYGEYPYYPDDEYSKYDKGGSKNPDGDNDDYDTYDKYCEGEECDCEKPADGIATAPTIPNPDEPVATTPVVASAGVSAFSANLMDSGIHTFGGGHLPWRFYDNGYLVLESGTFGTIQEHLQGFGGPNWWHHNWNTEKIILEGPITPINGTISNLFRSTSARAIENLHYLDTSQVTNMSQVFGGWTESLDLSSWDTSNVTNMRAMFWGMPQLTDLNLTGWDTSNVTNMSGMFSQTALPTHFDLTHFDVSSVVDMNGMFTGTSMINMDFPSSSMTHINLSGWNVASLRYMSGMFENRQHLRIVDVSGWSNANQLVNLSGAFRWTAIESIDLSHWDVSNVRYMQRMFENTSLMTDFNGDGWNTSSVLTFFRMFSGTISLVNFNAYGWSASSGAEMSNMFGWSGILHAGFGPGSLSHSNQEIYVMQHLDLSSWDVSQARNLMTMFLGMLNLETLDLEGWDTSRAINNSMSTRSLLSLPSLRQFTLGSDFHFNQTIGVTPPFTLDAFDGNGNPVYGGVFDSFIGHEGLFPAPNNAVYTGHWRNVGTGTVDNPRGEFIFTNTYLMENFDGAIHADTWVWEPWMHNVTYIVVGDEPAMYSPALSGIGGLYRPTWNVTISSDLTTTSTTHNGVSGTWVFNGWTHPTITGTTFVMPAYDVEFEGTWTFTPAPTTGGGAGGGNTGGGNTNPPPYEPNEPYEPNPTPPITPPATTPPTVFPPTSLPAPPTITQPDTQSPEAPQLPAGPQPAPVSQPVPPLQAPASPQPAPDMVKQPSLMSVYVGGEIDWVLRGFHNRSGEDVSNFAIIDMPGRGLNFVSGQIPAFANSEGVTFDIRYTVYGSDVWHTFASNLDASRPQSFGLPQLGNTWYTNIEFYFGDVPAGFAFGDEIVLTFVAGEDAPDNALVNRFFVGYNDLQREGESPDMPMVTHRTPQQTSPAPSGEPAIQQSVGNVNPQTSDDFNGTVFIVFASGAVLSLGTLVVLTVRRKKTTS